MVDKVFLLPIFHELLPVGHSKPIPIFDSLQKEMISDSVELNIPIALVYASPLRKKGFLKIPSEELPFVSKICGYGYPIVTEIFTSGEMMIILHGIGKLEIKSVDLNHKGYLVASVQEIYEKQSIRSENLYLCQNLRGEFLLWCRKHMDSRRQREHVMNATHDPISLIALCSEFMVSSPDLRQKILEQDDINRKLHTIIIDHDLSA